MDSIDYYSKRNRSSKGKSLDSEWGDLKKQKTLKKPGAPQDNPSPSKNPKTENNQQGK